MLLVHGIEPLTKHVQAWLDMLHNSFKQPGVEATPKLCDRADVIGGPAGFALQMFKLCNILMQRIALHLYL